MSTPDSQLTDTRAAQIKNQCLLELSDAWDDLMKMQTMKVREFRIVFEGDVPKVTALLNKKPRPRPVNRV